MHIHCMILINLDLGMIILPLSNEQVKVSGSVKNKGWTLETVDYKDASQSETLRIRGFKFNKVEQLEKKYSEPGKFSLTP